MKPTANYKLSDVFSSVFSTVGASAHAVSEVAFAVKDTAEKSRRLVGLADPLLEAGEVKAESYSQVSKVESAVKLARRMKELKAEMAEDELEVDIPSAS
jgi:hypothetical protein